MDKTTLRRLWTKTAIVLLCLAAYVAQSNAAPKRPRTTNSIQPVVLYNEKTTSTIGSAALQAEPFEKLLVSGATGTLTVTDGKGREYVRTATQSITQFIVAGALGTHTLRILDDKGIVSTELTFTVDAKTKVSDNGYYSGMFDLLYKGMCVYSANGEESIDYNGTKVHFFVPWGLDHYNTLKGMQYFSGIGNELIDVMRKKQHPDGMIYSFISGNKESAYYESAYSWLNCFERDGNVYFVRQPTENHVEYIYVNTIYQHWKASGNDAWMKQNLESAARALDYTINSPLRWSQRFQLLKRPYTIDSWDFQIDDEYTPNLGIGNSMLIDAQKTKFGVFYGDNTGYIQACNELAKMYEAAGLPAQAKKYRSRANDILQRLNDLTWNGRFYTHFIEEDSTVKRNLGVDEKSQISQSNMYSLNRGLPHEQNVAIINTYQQLRKNLPVGSPGEWYAIYPPFERGFGSHNEKWQYMNGGVAGHAVGELARGAYENGYEAYATDVLNRLFELGKKYKNRIWFAYTGSFPAAPKVTYKPLDLSKYANMDLWDKGGKKAFNWMNISEQGNDMRNLPVGNQQFAGINFNIANPETNNRRSAVAVSTKSNFPTQVDIPVNAQAPTVYLLHTANNVGSEQVCGSLTFKYTDGTQYVKYILQGKHLTGWWFTSLNRDDAGTAWTGPNLKSTQVGVCWAAIENPNPSKTIRSLTIQAAADGAIYSVLGITLADQPHYVKPKGESFGGPDNWAAANAMAALMEGLAGVTDESTAYEKPVISPRWNTTSSDSVHVVARYAASKGYVAYTFKQDLNAKKLYLQITGSGSQGLVRLLLPEGIQSVKSVLVDGQVAQATLQKVEHSVYAQIPINMVKISVIELNY